MSGKNIAKLLEALGTTPLGAERLKLLTELLVEEGHDRYEDIVFELGMIGDPTAIQAIARAANISFEDLVRCGNLHEFQRKCAYALARIGTDESRTVLQDMARSSDDHLREYGKEGLNRWPLLDRAE